MARRTRFFVTAGAVLTVTGTLVGCLQDFDSFLPTGGSGGGTSTSTGMTSSSMSSSSMSSSSTGMPPECTPMDTSMCAPATNDCEQPICDAMGMCGIGPKPAKATCATSGPQKDQPGVCDGSSVCLGCIDATDCPLVMGEAQLCPQTGMNANTCVPAGCMNGEKDGQETFKDCGGPVCPGCAIGQDCLVNGDCGSGSCSNGTKVCQACANNGDCDAANYCDTAVMPDHICKAKEVQGTPCPLNDDGQCATGNCVEGVCCNSACNGVCESCLAANTPQPDGTCADIDAGQDPDMECSAGGNGCRTGNCDGAGACGFKAAGSTCGSGPMCVAGSPSTAVNPQDVCAGGSDTCNAGSNMTCNAGFTCTNNACNTTCSSDTHCVSNNCEATAGSPKLGTCVVCNGPGDCSGGLQCEESITSALEDTCVTCRQSVAAFPAANSDCSASTAGKGCIAATDTCGCSAASEGTTCAGIAGKTHCATTGTNNAKCVECDVGNAAHCSADPQGKLCLDGAGGSTINTCGCKVASEATDCTAAGKTHCATTPAANAFTCQECDVGNATHCMSNVKGKQCLNGQFTGPVNVCGCLVSSEATDCTAMGKTHCVNMGVNSFTCQECNDDAHCTDGGMGKGKKCSPTGGVANTCGCNNNGDCTGTCDTANHVCN